MEHSKFHLDLNRCILWNFDPGIEIFVYIISIKVFLAGYFVFSLIVCRYYVALQRIHPNPSLPNLSHNNHSYSIVCKIRYPDIQISTGYNNLLFKEKKCWHDLTFLVIFPSHRWRYDQLAFYNFYKIIHQFAFSIAKLPS